MPQRDDKPVQRPPVVTVLILVAIGLVFFWQLSLQQSDGQAPIYALGLIPSVLFGLHELPAEIALVPSAVTVFTSMFMHSGWMHVLGNALYLRIYGDNAEDAMGPPGF